MKTFNITPNLTQSEKADLLWNFMTELYDEVEMERVDGGYSINIEFETEDEE
jgi:hypothetical protein